MLEKYDSTPIEGKWQEIWSQQKTFRTPDPLNDPKKRPKYYCLSMLPYPSGAIHMGHVRNYSIGDAISRYQKMRGFNVLQPIGWDAFGLPAENAAIQRGVHPHQWTLENIAQMKQELLRMGFAYDWDREVATCRPEYYRWEQKMFVRMYHEGLAYKKTGIVNWCNQCQSVLANEQVVDGACWRCDSPVVMKELSQWYLKITKYAAELLSGHEELRGHWPDRVLEMQRHWIGESRGCRILFPVVDRNDSIEVFTTRADTLFGVTFLTLSAHHPLADSLCSNKGALTNLRQEVDKKSFDIRSVGSTEKKGFFTGAYAKHPYTSEKIPIWIGNFVVMEYGTGAVMAVPAHDERDFEFAKIYKLPIRQVIEGEGACTEKAFVDYGKLISSGSFSGISSEEALRVIPSDLASRNLGGPTLQYRLRDWGVSRQRYWGAPIPIVYCSKCGTLTVPDKDLPVLLPTDVQFTGKKGNPLDHHPDFKNTQCPQCQGRAERETDTMDTFMESSWYFLRYTSPKNDREAFSSSIANQWMPVDFYVGGIEHACMHLLYARFFHKVLRDWGLLNTNEPFKKLLTQGMVIKDGAKMSKSKGNVVTPTSIIESFGADTARLFSLFAAPPEKDLDWNEKGVEGCHRFLHRIWRLFYQFRDSIASVEGLPQIKMEDALMPVLKKTHWMIAKITEDNASQKFNTAVAALMEMANEIYGVLDRNPQAFLSSEGKKLLRHALESLLLCMAPYAPHVSEELWQSLGHKTLISEASWPKADPTLLENAEFLLVVQINGKVRERLMISKSLSKDEVEKRVLSLEKIRPFLEGKTIRQFVYVPERIANVVVQ